MKKLIKYVFILSFCVAFSQKKVTLSQALNIASKQSMLSGRLAKGKVFKATNNDSETKQKLGVSLIQFEQNLSILKEMNLPADIRLKIVTVEMLWTGYKQAILDSERASVKKAIDFNDVVISHTKDIFNSILAISKAREEYPYNSKLVEFPAAYTASNDLKHLSQQLSLYYNAYFSKVKNYDAQAFDALVGEIDNKIVDVLKLKEITDPQIESKTRDLQNKWIVLKSKVEAVAKDFFVTTAQSPKPEYIFKQSDLLLKEADLLTRLYRANNAIN